MFRPLGLLGNANNLNLNQTSDLLFLMIYALDEYLESELSERDKKELLKYSKKLNEALETGDFSNITKEFIDDFNKVINNLGEM